MAHFVGGQLFKDIVTAYRFPFELWAGRSDFDFTWDCLFVLAANECEIQPRSCPVGTAGCFSDSFRRKYRLEFPLLLLVLMCMKRTHNWA
jgi:hypothetical protein